MASRASLLRSVLFVYRDAVVSSVQPKIALSCDTVASELAARVAANFLNPCADFFMPTWIHALLE